VNRTVLIPLAVIVLAAACEDRPAPTAPTTPPSSSLTAPDASATSTVCRAYKNELDRINAQRAQNQAAAGLQQKADAYDRLVADACN